MSASSVLFAASESGSDEQQFNVTGNPELDAKSLQIYLRKGELKLASLPLKTERDVTQTAEANSVHNACRNARKSFMEAHTVWLYEQLSIEYGASLRLDELVYAAADFLPGLVPTKDVIAQEQQHLQANKEAREIDQGIFFWGMLKNKVVGQKIVENMLKPTARAQELLSEFFAKKKLNLGSVSIEQKGSAAEITFLNDHCLNAEDNELIRDLEVAVDLVLLDDSVRVGVLRGGVVSNPRYAGRRVFSAGINLKHLHQGKISFVEFLLGRELGYINKIIRGINPPEGMSDWRNQKLEKPWLAAVDTFAIGGGAQLLLACDMVLASAESYFCLPAAKEGIVPGVSNLRLGKLGTGSLAKQIILHGRKIWAREGVGEMLFDKVVEPQYMDEEMENCVNQLESPAVVSNRRMLTMARENTDSFREYMAEFSLEQSIRLYGSDVLEKVRKV